MNLKKLSRPVIIFLAFLLVVLLAILDNYISIHRSLIIFYLIPVSLVVWYCGPVAGVFITVCSIISWFVTNINAVSETYFHPVFFYFNMIARACFLFIVTYVITRLKSAMRREKELNERKSDFVANVSHELKNPLSITKEALSNILDGMSGPINPEQKQVIEIGKKNIERLVRLVTDLLDLSKIEAGKIKLKLEEIDLKQLIDEILKAYEKEISKKQLVLKKDIQETIGLVWADRDRLSEVIINLLSNAIKYAPHGTITIKLVGDEKEVRFGITDTGPGIPVEYQQKIFDKFERVTAEKNEGTGLGLPIARDIMTLHKGKLWVESKPGKGSKFIFIFPRNFKTHKAQ